VHKTRLAPTTIVSRATATEMPKQSCAAPSEPVSFELSRRSRAATSLGAAGVTRFRSWWAGGIGYVAASGVDGHDGMTILDVKDPTHPMLVNQIAGNSGLYSALWSGCELPTGRIALVPNGKRWHS